MTSFCWLPPDSARAGSSGLGGRTSNRWMMSSVRRRTSRWFSIDARRNRRPVVIAEDGVLPEVELEQQPAAMPVFRNVRDAALASPAGIEPGKRRAGQ